MLENVKIAEIVGELSFLFRGNHRYKPKQKEKSHHRGYEIGISNLPATAVGCTVTFFDLSDQDCLRLVCH